MSVSGHFSRLLRVGAAGCVGTLGCARPAPVAPVALPTEAAGQVAPPAAPLRSLVLHDVRWQLRSGDDVGWADVPLALHTFTLGRWECALGEVLSDDALGATELDLRRTRRLACTHATGATVQTQLACTLHSARTQARASELGSAGAACASTDASSGARELQLQLDATAPLHIRCAPAEVAQLVLISRDKRQIAWLCVDASGIRECTASAATSVAPTPPAPP